MYGAWGSMSTLVDQGFVAKLRLQTREKGPSMAFYKLTERGMEKAKQCDGRTIQINDASNQAYRAALGLDMASPSMGGNAATLPESHRYPPPPPPPPPPPSCARLTSPPQMGLGRQGLAAGTEALHSWRRPGRKRKYSQGPRNSAVSDSTGMDTSLWEGIGSTGGF